MKKLLYIFLISMVPLIELRGGVIAGAAMGLPWWQNYIVCVLGNILPVPFILFFVEKIFAWMKKRRVFPGLVDWLENKALGKSKKVTRYADRHDPALSPSAGSPADLPTAETDPAPTDEAADLPAAAETDPAETRRTGKVTFYALLGLFVFVAFPVPGTGAWTGTLIAALLHMPRRRAFFAVALGVLFCGVIMTLASYGFVAGLSFLAAAKK